MATSIPKSVLTNAMLLFGVEELKTEQKEILKSIVQRKDCIAVLPTGFGKSLPFQMYLPVVREMRSDRNGKVLVCCPLVALMQDQVEKLSRIDGLIAAYKDMLSSTESDNRIKTGDVDVIYASPETLVGDSQWREYIQKLDVELIVIDEFHTIAIWGEDKSGKQAFRKWFAHIGELRSLFPNATILALSATCTIKIRRKVIKYLQLKEDTKEIMLLPNKPNIKLSVAKISNELEAAMWFLDDGLADLKDNFPKTIIYCNSINDTSKLYNYIVTELPECSNYVEMFHSETPECTKHKIVSDLKEETSRLRIVISTSALGMGFDVKNCNSVILYGLPNNFIDLLQENGRVGRDGGSSVALLLYNSHDLRQLSSKIKEVLKTTECRRKVILKNFLKTVELQSTEATDFGKHTCCDLCAKRCSCNSYGLLPLEKIFHRLQSVDDNAESETDDSDKTEEYDLSDYENFNSNIDVALLQLDPVD